MKKIIIFGLVFTILILSAMSCERIRDESTVKKVIPLTSLPLDYGALVAVTSDARYPDWAQLWFSDEAGTIKMVRVNWTLELMVEGALIISRN
jgi:hypothetical protein